MEHTPPDEKPADAEPHVAPVPDCDCRRREGQAHAPWCAVAKWWWAGYFERHGQRR